MFDQPDPRVMPVSSTRVAFHRNPALTRVPLEHILVKPSRFVHAACGSHCILDDLATPTKTGGISCKPVDPVSHVAALEWRKYVVEKIHALHGFVADSAPPHFSHACVGPKMLGA